MLIFSASNTRCLDGGGYSARLMPTPPLALAVIRRMKLPRHLPIRRSRPSLFMVIQIARSLVHLGFALWAALAANGGQSCCSSPEPSALHRG